MLVIMILWPTKPSLIPASSSDEGFVGQTTVGFFGWGRRVVAAAYIYNISLVGV